MTVDEVLKRLEPWRARHRRPAWDPVVEEGDVPFMFGDVGRGHVTQCPDHEDVVAFGWACS